MKASTVGNVRILDTADVFPKAEKPKKPLIVIVATLLGGMPSVAFILIKTAFNRGITNPQDFSDVGLTVYATIPVSDTQTMSLAKQKLKDKIIQKLGRNNKVEKENPTDSAIEAIRSLRTSLHFAMLGAKNNVVMISGASPMVGKSFVSTNLAAVIAQAGQKVVLIDADMRIGYSHKLFNVTAEQGLSDNLIGDIDTAKAIKPTTIENLDFISRRKIPPNPS